jgi:hypothetical protein
MMTSVECLAKADELDAVGYECRDDAARKTFATLAMAWRRTAIMARHQEAHPDADLVSHH